MLGDTIVFNVIQVVFARGLFYFVAVIVSTVIVVAFVVVMCFKWLLRLSL